MADYINSNILCQAYLHIDPVNIPDERLEALKKELDLFLATRGRFFIYDAVTTSVEFKEGSLKVYAGIAGAIYVAIGQYADFRSGIDYLANDTKRLAECIVSETLFLSQSRHDNTIRVEARTGVVGSLKLIVDKIEFAQRELPIVDLKATNGRLASAHEDIERLLANLNDPKDVSYVSDQLCSLIRTLLPKTPPPNPKRTPAPETVSVYQARRAALIELTRDVSEGKKSPAPPKKKKETEKERITAWSSRPQGRAPDLAYARPLMRTLSL